MPKIRHETIAWGTLATLIIAIVGFGVTVGKVFGQVEQNTTSIQRQWQILGTQIPDLQHNLIKTQTQLEEYRKSQRRRDDDNDKRIDRLLNRLERDNGRPAR